MSKKLFITGTGTDIGKTFVSGLILKKLRQNGVHSAYYKAAMSGNHRRPDGSLIPGDAMYVKEISGIEQPLEEMCPYVYEHAVSPHLASVLENSGWSVRNMSMLLWRAQAVFCVQFVLNRKKSGFRILLRHVG